MLYMCIIGCIPIIAGIICFIVYQKQKQPSSDTLVGCGCVLWILGLIFLFIMFCSWLDYSQFEKQYEIQKEQYEMFVDSDITEENISYIFDFMETNKRLSGYQANVKWLKDFSPYPERVLDLEPIGLPFK